MQKTSPPPKGTHGRHRALHVLEIHGIGQPGLDRLLVHHSQGLGRRGDELLGQAILVAGDDSSPAVDEFLLARPRATKLLSGPSVTSKV